MCSLLRQEYEFVEPIGIACNLVVVARSLVTYDESLQVGGVLEAALLNIGYRLWQDDGLQLVAEIEHIVARLVVRIDEVVWTVTLVWVNLVLLQFGTVKVQVAQTSTGWVAVVHVGTRHEAQHTDVDAVERTFHHQ